MAASRKRLRSSTSIASATWSYSPGAEVVPGAPGHCSVEEAAQLEAAGVFVPADKGKRTERATAPTPERATARRGRKGKAEEAEGGE